ARIDTVHDRNRTPRKRPLGQRAVGAGADTNVGPAEAARPTEQGVAIVPAGRMDYLGWGFSRAASTLWGSRFVPGAPEMADGAPSRAGPAADRDSGAGPAAAPAPPTI